MKKISTYNWFLLLIIISCFLPFYSKAQTPLLDSLKLVLKNNPQENTVRADVLNALCRAFLTEMNDKEKMDEYGNKLYQLSKKLNYKKGIAYAYLNMGTVRLGKSNYDGALDYYFKALHIFQESHNIKGMGSCYQNIGNTKSNQGKYAEALEYSLKGTKLREELGEKQGIAAAYNNVALIYVNLGNYQKALEYHFKSLRMKEAIHDKLGISISYVNIGNVFDQQNKFNESRQYQQKALKLKIELSDKEGEAIVYNNMALSYGAQKNYVDALAYHLKSLKLREEIQDLQGVSMSYSNIGITYLAQDKIDEALPYFIKALKLSRELGDKVGEISALSGAGNCYEKNKNFVKAIDFYTKGLMLSKESNYKLGIRDAYLNLASSNEKIKNYSAALSYNKLFSSVKDILLNEASLKQASELNTEYETDKKEKEILLLTKDQQLKDKTLKEQRLVRIGLIIGLGLFLALSFLLFNRYRFKQKANLILEKQKQEIHQKNTMITDSIDYAKTIQEAILPDDEKLNAFFPEYFILYKPKAIVSGDFYWIGKKDDQIICAVADCTGHGVPGAFMSLLGHNILENVIQRDTAVNPGAILTLLNEEIVTRFSKGKEKETVKHGMDIALISIDSANRQLQYAGANNSLYRVRENILTEIKADKISTGVVGKDHAEVHYMNNKNELKKDDMLYLFSDGFPDQKGGPNKKKFFYQPFKDLLISIHALPVEEQKQKLEATITNWIGAGEQIDDILVMGIKI